MNLLHTVILLNWCFLFAISSRRSNNADDSSLSMLVGQLKNLEGVSKCNMFIDKHIQCKMVQRLLVLLTKSLPTVSMKKCKSLKWRRYERTNFYEGFKHYGKCREDVRLFNYPTKNSIFIYIFPINNDGRFIEYVQFFWNLYKSLACPTSTPKVLFITTTKFKIPSYASLFHVFPEESMNLELLDISSRGHASKKQTRWFNNTSHRFTVHKWNGFSKRYRLHHLSKSSLWFQEKYSNLHKFKLSAKVYSQMVRRYDYLNKRTVSYDLTGLNSRLSKYLKASMNFTWICANRYNFGFPEGTLSPGICSLNPCLAQVHYFYTPLIYDVDLEVDISSFLICFALLFVVLFLLHIQTSLGRFDSRTWSPLITVNMLLGMNSPYNPQLITESLLFIMLSICGIFCANDIYEALASLIVPLSTERTFFTLQDLKTSDIALILSGIPAELQESSLSEENGKVARFIISDEIQKSHIKCTLLSDRDQRELKEMHKLVHLKNISISIADKITDQLYGSVVKVNGQVIARRSRVSEYFRVVSFEISSFLVLKERLSMSYWQFIEHGFKYEYSKYMYRTVKLRRGLLEKNLDGTPLVPSDDKDSEEPDYFTLTIVLIVLTVGTSMAFITLLGEIVYAI